MKKTICAVSMMAVASLGAMEDVHEQNKQLRFEIMMGHIEFVSLCLNAGTNPCTTNGLGGTFLHTAAGASDSIEHITIANLLLDKGANVNAGNIGNSTPLHSAAASGHANMVQLLLDRGADPNIADANGKTPLYYAAERGHNEVIGILTPLTNN